MPTAQLTVPKPVAPTWQAIEMLVRADADAAPFISIHLPTHPLPTERVQDRTRLRNLLRWTSTALEGRGFDHHLREALLDAPRRFLEASAAWRTVGRGLALFFSRTGPAAFRLDAPPPEGLLIGAHFAVRRVLPAVTDHVACHLLTLSQSAVRLCRAERDSLVPVNMPDAPRSMADLARFLEAQKSLHCHSGSAHVGVRSGRTGMIHGHGLHHELTDTRVREFLTLVDHGLRRALPPPCQPLVLAGDERVVSAFRGLSEHPTIAADAIIGNVDRLNDAELLARLRPIRGDIAAVRRDALLERYRAAAGSQRSSTDPGAIALAASAGQVELLIAPWSDPLPDDEEPASGPRHIGECSPSAARIERAVVDTLRAAGTVQVVSQEEMPDGATMASILRPGAGT